MNIRKWLLGVIVFLLAPSLLFATLWIKSSINEVKAVERALTGLEMVQTLGPLIRERLQEPTLSDAPENLELRGADILTPEELRFVQTTYDAFISEPSRAKSIRHARSIVRTISQSVMLASIPSFETAELPDLLSDRLLTSVVRANEMVRSGEQLAQKPLINSWDRMSLPVQGGQFKAAADEVDRIANEQLPLLEMAGSHGLRTLMRAYGRANGFYQNAGATLLLSVYKAETGSDIAVSRLKAALPHFVNTTMNLWDGTIEYLAADLSERRDITIVSVVIAAALGLGIIFIAFGLAFILSRSIADRTLEEFHKLGYHDPLTGLANRRGLMKTIDAVAQTNCDGITGLIQIDLRRFKAINHRYGDQIGDATLQSVSEAFARSSQEGDFVARTGGTEFTLLRRNVESVADFKEQANRLNAEIGRERRIHNHKIRLESSIGVSITEQGIRPTEQLLTDATLATRSAKAQGTGAVCVFEAEMRDTFEKNTEIARDLKTALKDGNIIPWYQPQVSADSGLIVGAEALVRWVDIQQGVRFPGSFLPAAVEAGYMDTLDMCVRKQAMDMAARLMEKNDIPFHIGLNVSAELLAKPDCVDLLLGEVKTAGLSTTQVSIEILEAVMIDEYTAAPIKANVARLSDSGFHVELDDFGTGHSSISSLRDLRVDRVKIDRSFVTGVDSNPDLQKFTSALIQLARSLDIRVLAEGVETEAERKWLADNGCDVIQGFLISKAVSEEDFLSRLSHWKPTVVQFPSQTAS